MTPHLIGIAGPSSSGKTELARRLIQHLPGTALVSLDSYYRGMEEIPIASRKEVNFDHPDALDWELLHEHLQAMAGGKGFAEPVYSFAEYARTSETRWIPPSEHIIVEGLFVLHWPELRGMLETKVYVQTDPAVCFERRMTRDVNERGRTVESVRRQYELTVLPGAEQFVVPTRKYADLVVSGEEPIERAVAAVEARLHFVRAATV
jgi:uridine kinase